MTAIHDPAPPYCHPIAWDDPSTIEIGTGLKVVNRKPVVPGKPRWDKPSLYLHAKETRQAVGPRGNWYRIGF